jgi:anti-anti-sigma factor
MTETPGFEADTTEAVTTFEGREVTVTIRGRIDDFSAREFGVILDAAADRQPRSVVLELRELDFMGAAGLVVVTNVEKRLAALGVRLLIRSPSALIEGLLGIVKLAEASRRGRRLSEHEHLGPEQSGESNVTAPQFGLDLSTKNLTRLTAMPANPDVVDGALRFVVELARASVGGADGVSVSLRRHGVLSTVAASDQTILAMDADQYATGEGPCVEASVEGRWFHAESLDAETRWPAFTPRARELGIKAILSSPLRAFDEPVGALNIYSRTAEAFEIEDQAAAARFAQQASALLSDALAGVSDAQMGQRFQDALRSREVITLAKGIIMEREGIDEDSSFNALLRLSLYQGIPLRQRAEAVVSSSRRPQLGPEWGLDD